MVEIAQENVDLSQTEDISTVDTDSDAQRRGLKSEDKKILQSHE